MREFTWVMLSAGLLLANSGCGGSGSSSATDADNGTQNTTDTSTNPAGDDTSSNDGTSSGTANGQGSPAGASTVGPQVTERDGRKWIDDIPLNVWYVDPTGIANQTDAVASNVPTEGTTDPGSTVEPQPMPKPAAGGKADWKSIITADAIDKEVTSIRNRLNGDLQSLGKYNGAVTGLPPYTATLAALAGIANEHPDEVRWKKNSKYIWALAGQMNSEMPRRGVQSYRPLKQNFDNIIDTLSGAVPPGVDDPGDGLTFADTAPFSWLMKRLESSETFFKVNGGSEDAMKSNAEKLIQEAMVVGGISQLLNREGYGYEGDEEFDVFVKAMIDSTKQMREGVETEDFKKYDLAVSKMTQACQECHSGYRG